MAKSNNERFGSLDYYILFMSNVNEETALVNGVHCKEWSGKLTHNGYARGSWDNKSHRMHRYLWELENDMSAGLCMVCHICDNRKCIEVKHLFLGTAQNNADDMIAKGRARHEKHNEERRRKISEALTGKIGSRLGIPHTEETKSKIRAKRALQIMKPRKKNNA